IGFDRLAQTPVENNNEKQQNTAAGADRVRRGCHFSGASGPRTEPTKKPAAVSHPGVMNALFWKILVTRVNSFLWRANLLSSPRRGVARAISVFTRVFDALWRVVRCRHRSRVYPRSALKCAQVGQARLAWTVTHRFLAEMLQREHLLGVARRRWPA